MDDEADNHSNHVHSQLPGHHLQVLDGDDLTTDQTSNTKWRVPEKLEKLLFKLPLNTKHKLCIIKLNFRNYDLLYYFCDCLIISDSKKTTQVVLH